jgi:CHAT domain-containing protein
MASSVREIAAIIIGISISACSRPLPVDDSYRHAWSAYLAGNLPQAVEEASRSAERWRNDSNSPWFWRFRLLEAEILTAQAKAPEARALLSDPVPARSELTQLEVRRLIDKAQLSRKDEAAEILERARVAVQDPELAIRLNLVQGFLAANQRQTEAARSAFRAALDLAVQQGNLYWQAQALSNLSFCSKTQNRYEESIDLGLQALALAERAGARRVAAFAHGNLGSAYSYLGEFDSALEHQEAAVKILEAIGARSNLMIALGEVGGLYDHQDEPRKAIPNYERAYQISVELNSNVDAGRHARNLSLAFAKTEEWDAAEKWNQRAFEFASLIHDKNWIPYYLRNRALIACGRGRLEEARRICEEALRASAGQPSVRWETYDLLGKIDSDGKRFAQARQDFESALEIIDGTRSELLDSHFKITLLSRLILFYQDYVGALVEQNNDAEALRVVESSRSRVLTERLGRDLKQGQFPGPAHLQRLARATNSSLLSFWLAPKQSFAWLITANGVRRFNLPPAGEIEKLITGYRESIEHSLRDPVAGSNPFAAQLWNGLLCEIAPNIPHDSRLIVIPDGALHRLNLETLVVPSPQPHYWIEDVEIAVAPSISIAAWKPVSRGRRPASLLLIGAPDYKGTRYESLEKAGSEVRDIQDRFAGVSQAVYTGPQASPAAYREADPSRFSLIHFAAHAEANREKPLESAVILSHQGESYKLYARDVIDIPIHADLVTISACRSAGVRAYAGEGLIGFAWAFLQAGARAVVAGLWDVSDSSTELLMNRFYSGIAAGQDPVSAMRHAKLWLLGNDPQYRKPYYWASFEVYVGSAAR